MNFVLLGEPASKANSRRAVLINGLPRFIKSKKAMQYVAEAVVQLRHMFKGVENLPIFPDGDLVVTMTIHYCTRRPDLDESLILDVLEGFLYKNDRQIREKHIFHALDKESPRTEIHIQPRS